MKGEKIVEIGNKSAAGSSSEGQTDSGNKGKNTQEHMNLQSSPIFPVHKKSIRSLKDGICDFPCRNLTPAFLGSTKGMVAMMAVRAALPAQETLLVRIHTRHTQ